MINVQDILRPLGISKCYKGFYHACYAISLAVSDDSRLVSVTKNIYIPTACRFGCKWTAIERNIRTVVAHAWRTNPDLVSQMAGYKLDRAPSSSEFIEIVSTHIIRTNHGLS